MKCWLVVGWLLLPSVLCAQETAEAEPESEPIARAIAYPKDVPALAASDQGQIQTPDTPSAAPPVELPRALPLSPHEAAASPSPVPSTAPAPAELKALPGRTGYAFDQPEILVRQRLFGLAHGVSLLAAACVDLPEQSAAIQKSFVAWHAQQAAAIDQVVHDLAKYYFGPQAAVAQWQDLTRALNLKDYIDQSLGQFELSVACASLTQAITGPRYDLAALLQVEPLIAMKTIAGEVVPASATAAQPAQATNAINATSVTSTTNDAPAPAAVPATNLVPSAATEPIATPAPTEALPLPDEPRAP